MRLFAGLRECLGVSTLPVELPAGATVTEALSRLEQQHPALAGQTFAVAVNERYVRADQALAEQDELALIPPVSGG